MNALFTIEKSTFVATVQLLFMNSSCKPPKSKSKTRAKKKKKRKVKCGHGSKPILNLEKLFTVEKLTFVATVRLLFTNSSRKPSKSKSKTCAKKKK